MPKFFKTAAIITGSVSIALVVLGYNFFPIMSGFSAKVACSCAFNSGRTANDIIENELSILPLNFTKININFVDSTAAATVFGFARKKAIYSSGLGCTLLNQADESTVRNTGFSKPLPPQNPDSVEWPLGNKNMFPVSITYDDSLLNRAVDYAFTNNNKSSFGTRSIVISHQNKIVKERYSNGFTAETPQAGWSMCKSVTNALIGILVKQGKLNVGQKKLFTNWLKDDRQKISLGNLLNANSGLYWREVYTMPSPATNMLFTKDDMPLFAGSFKLEDQPGTRFKYSSGTSNILSAIIRQQTGSNYYHFVYDQLSNKVGMHTAVMEADAGGTFVGSSYCFASARDWMRFGLLYLNDGMVNGERILPEGWVKYSTTPATGALKGEYGAQFWLNAGQPKNPSNRTFPGVPTDCFYAEGYQGQQIFIIPSYNVVIVRLSLQNTTEFDEDKFISMVLKAIKK